MQIGYARISSADQTLDLQLDALKRAGCERVLSDTASGATADRPGLSQALALLRPADLLVVWRLDRLARSLHHLLDTLQELDRRAVGFKSLSEHLDTTTPGGTLIFQLCGALAECERELIRERTQVGRTAARARGRTGGRPRVQAFRDPAQLALAKQLYYEQRIPAQTICQRFAISRPTFYRYLRASNPTPTSTTLAS